METVNAVLMLVFVAVIGLIALDVARKTKHPSDN